MNRVRSKAKALENDRHDAASIEYGLIATGLLLATVPPMAIIGGNLGETCRLIAALFGLG